MKKILSIATTLLLAIGAWADDTLVTLPEGVEAEEYTLKITHRIYQGENQTTTESKEITTLVAFSGTDVYVSGLAYYFPKAYVKGTLSGDKATFTSGQFVGADQYGSEYLTSFVTENGKGIITDFVLNYDGETRALTFDESINLSETSASNGGGFYADVVSAVFTLGGLPPLVPVAVPEGLQTEPYLLNCERTINEENDEGEFELVVEPYQLPLQIGFNGDDLYIQGIVEGVSYAWAKATKNSSGKYVIPSGQYVGTAQLYNQVWDYFLSSIGRSGALSDIILTYDAETATFTTTQTIAPTASEKKADSYYTLNGVTIKKIVEREATPSAPLMTFHRRKSPYGSTVWCFAEIFVSLSDTEERPMLSEKLSYVFLCDKGDDNISPVTFPKSKYYMLDEDITEIPYNFTDGLDISRHTVYFEKLGENELKTWKRLGLQTIYRGNDIEHRSEITWVNLEDLWGGNSVESIQSPVSAPTRYYDLQGRPVEHPAKGLYIVNGKKVYF